MSLPNILALKPYLETIRSYCNDQSKSELTDLLCEIAQEVPAKDRLEFLERFGIIRDMAGALDGQDYDEILSRVEGVIEDIIERQESIEDGSYYEEHYDEYDDYEPYSISGEQRENLEALFSEADQLFLAGNFEKAEKVFRELTGLFGHNSHRDMYFEIPHYNIDINWNETLARYYRCVYETSASKERASNLISVMEVEHPVYENHYDKTRVVLPFLRDVYDAKDGEADGWTGFLEAFRNEVKRIRGNRAFLLFLEAVNWLDGLDAVASEVRREKVPVGYLYWLDQLQVKESWHELAEASQESLDNMSFGGLRAYAAKMLCLAGDNKKDNFLVLRGKRELFFSEPDEENLVVLLKESIRQNEKETELKKVFNFLVSVIEKGSQVETGWYILKIKIMLMQGKLREAYSEIDRKAFIGWSYGKQTTGIVCASVLLTLSRGSSEVETIHRLFDSFMVKEEGENLIRDEISDRLSTLHVSEPQKEVWFQFLREIVTNRIDSIVSNKHRRAYARAAEILGGYMECLILNDQKNDATDFLDLNRNRKYNRFSAFRRELDNVLKSSPLLDGF